MARAQFCTPFHVVAASGSSTNSIAVRREAIHLKGKTICSLLRLIKHAPTCPRMRSVVLFFLLVTEGTTVKPEQCFTKLIQIELENIMLDMIQIPEQSFRYSSPEKYFKMSC